MHIVPEHYCVDCKHCIGKTTAACTARATLTRDPVSGDPIWLGLLECAGRRIGERRVRCPDYKEKS